MITLERSTPPWTIRPLLRPGYLSGKVTFNYPSPGLVHYEIVFERQEAVEFQQEFEASYWMRVNGLPHTDYRAVKDE
jgi:hypothetical protein